MNMFHTFHVFLGECMDRCKLLLRPIGNYKGEYFKYIEIRNQILTTGTFI